MSTESRTAKDIFVELVSNVPPAEWDERLQKACQGDDELRNRVRALLRAHAEPGSFLEQPAVAADATILHESPISERPGTIIGPYKLLQQIGEGGMGVVFMAEQTHPVQRKVALKVIKPGMDSRQVIARFEAERQALAIMDHVNIARVLDAGTTPDGLPYFVMELVHGVPITKYCDDNRLTPRQRLELFVPVCQAIQHAHQKGIIHRDVKPSNVMITLYDGKPVPKVIDFGVAKATEQKLTERTLFTQYGTMVGTLEYMSPEQAEMSALGVDTRSDIYSLGVLLYELLTGSTPLSNKRMKEAAYAEVLRMIREEEPPKPSTRLSESGEALASISALRHTEPAKLAKLVRGELDWIVMKTLEKDRNRRYETAGGFAADVERYLNDETVQACPPSAWYRFRKFARRNKAALAMTTVVAAALVLAVVGLALSTAFITAAYQGETEQRLLADKNAEEASKNAAEAKQKENEAKLSAAEANKQQKIAEEQELLARRRFYAAQMNLAQQAWEAGARVRLLELLESQRPKFDEEDLRSFEWYYLWRLCHAGQRLSLTGHRGLVAAVAFSPDGKTLATASKGGTIKLWDTITGQVRLALSPPTEETCLAFSPDGKLLCVGGWSNFVSVWDVATGRQYASFQFQHWVRSATFSPDSKTLAAGLEDGSVRFWDVTTQTEQATLQGHAGPVVSVAYSPDGKILATASAGWGQDNGKTNLWDLAGKPVRLMRELPAAMTVAFSPDSKMLATGGYFYGAFIKLWDVTTGQEQIAFHGHRGLVTSVAFSPDGKTLASGSEDRTLRLWDVATGQERVQQAHLGVVRSVAFSPDGKTFASGSDDGTAKIWDVATAEGSDTLQQGGAVRSVMFVSDGKNLIAGGDCPTKWWNVPTGQEQVAVQVQMGLVALSPDARTLAALDSEGVLRLWDAATGRERARWQGHPKQYPVHVMFAPDGKTLASASGRDETIKLWDVATQQPRGSFQTGAGFPVSLAYSRDGKMLAVGTIHNTVKLWDLATSKERFAFSVGGEWIHIRSLAFSPDSKLLAAGTALGIVMLWDVQTGQLRASFKGHTAVVWSLAFSPDGKTLATASNDSTVKLWDVVTGQERLSLKGHKDSVNSVTFAPDGNTLATGSSDGTVKLWRAATDEEATAKKTELDLDDPQSPAAMNSWRDRLLKAGRMAEAQEAYRQAVSRLDKLAAEFPNVPDYPQELARSHFALGLLLAESGRPQEAEQAYRHAVDLFEKVAAKFPSAPDYRIEVGTSLANLAWPLAASADPSFRNAGRAVDLAKKAVELIPTDGFAWNTLGVAYYSAGDCQAAIDALAKCDELAPGRSFGFNAFLLAMAHWKLDKKVEARNWYDQGVQWMEKNKPEVEELRRCRAEAAELLGITPPQPTADKQPADDQAPNTNDQAPSSTPTKSGASSGRIPRQSGHAVEVCITAGDVCQTICLHDRHDQSIVRQKAVLNAESGSSGDQMGGNGHHLNAKLGYFLNSVAESVRF